MSSGFDVAYIQYAPHLVVHNCPYLAFTYSVNCDHVNVFLSFLWQFRSTMECQISFFSFHSCSIRCRYSCRIFYFVTAAMCYYTLGHCRRHFVCCIKTKCRLCVRFSLGEVDVIVVLYRDVCIYELLRRTLRVVPLYYNVNRLSRQRSVNLDGVLYIITQILITTDAYREVHTRALIN